MICFAALATRKFIISCGRSSIGRDFCDQIELHSLYKCMNKHTLSSLIEQNLSQRQIADKMGCSQATVKYWLRKWKLKTSYSRSESPYCRRCGEQDPEKLRAGCRYICKDCDSQRTIERFRRYKQRAVEYKGGKCCVCGYKECLSALDFHHLDPNNKDPDWKKMRNRSFERVRKELDKCVLVCNRCHVEVHAGVTQLAAY